MTDGRATERIRRLVEALQAVPFEEREAFIAGLSHEDRTAVLEAEAEIDGEVLPEDEELGGEG
jgi:signal transduction histidine kinase